MPAIAATLAQGEYLRTRALHSRQRRRYRLAVCGRVSAAVERIAAECGCRFLGHSDRQHYLAVRRALAYRVSKIVGEIEQKPANACAQSDVPAHSRNRLSNYFFGGFVAGQQIVVDDIRFINAHGAAMGPDDMWKTHFSKLRAA